MSDRFRPQTIDKPLIDSMTRKTGQSSVTTSKHSFTNDSDSEESSSGYFVALPQEFRPNLTPQLKQEKQRTKNISCNTKPSNNDSASSKCSSSTTVENRNHEDSESARRQKKTMYKYTNNSRQNTSFQRFQVNDECTENKNVAPTLCKQTVSTNHNLNSVIKIDNNKNIHMKTKTSPVLKTVITSKIGNGIIHQEVWQETHTRPSNNSLSFQEQDGAFPSKSSGRYKESRMQSEHTEKPEPGTIQINFELPSKDSSLNEKLEYTAKFSSEMKQSNTGIFKNENTAVLSPSRTKYPHPKVMNENTLNFQENTVQWNNELGKDKQKDYVKNTVQWKIIEEKNADSPARNKFKSKQPTNYSKSKQTYHIRKPLKEKPHQQNFNNSLQDENIKQISVENGTQRNQPKSRLTEKAYNELLSFYQNNFQEDTLNYVGTKIPDKKSAYSNLNNESSIKRKNELDTKSATSALSDIAQQENLHLHNSCGFNSRPPDFDHSEVKAIQKKTENKNLECNSSSSNFDDVKIKGLEEKDIFYYGKEMSDFIIGSHDALSMFIAIYKEWIISRKELIAILEQLEKNLEASSKKFTKYQDIVKYANTGIALVSAIPNPYTSIATRIVSVFTTLFSNFLVKPKNVEIDSSNEIASLLFKDTQASTDLYMYGLQCNQQFEETVKIIEEFYSKVKNYEILPPISGEIAIFVQGILEYKPTHRVFYKKLHKCFQELLQMTNKSCNRRFCEPFFLYSTTTVDVIGFLTWRFHCEDFSTESVQHELQQIHKMIMDSSTTSLKDLIARLQNCLRIMKEELNFVEKSLKDVCLFDTASEHAVKKE